MAENDFGKKVGDFGRNVWGKAQDVVDIASLKNDINARNRELSVIYAEIGEGFCKQQSAAARKAFPDLYEEANTLEGEIDRLQEKVQRRKGVKKCPGCGEMILVRAAYCNKCGCKVPDPETEGDDQLCRNCGASLDDEDLYCSCCGTKRN